MSTKAELAAGPNGTLSVKSRAREAFVWRKLGSESVKTQFLKIYFSQMYFPMRYMLITYILVRYTQ